MSVSPLKLEAVQVPANLWPDVTFGKPLVDFSAPEAQPAPWPFMYVRPESARALVHHSKWTWFLALRVVPKLHAAHIWLIRKVIGKRSVLANVNVSMHSAVTLRYHAALINIDVVPYHKC